MLRIKAVTIGFLASLLLPLVAHAQEGNSGSITGYVYDQTGNPIRGVKVTAASPTQIGGSKSAYTNDEGFFRFAALFPGDFEIRASAPKLKTYVQKDVRVGVSGTTELNVVMDVETQGVEEVKVVEKAPLVNTTTSTTKEVYDMDFVESLPMKSRDQVQTQMINEVAGAMNGRIRGGNQNQTLFMQDGFEINQTNGVYPVLKSSAAFEINTSGYGADAPTASGGMINLVTKTGSNKYEFEFNGTAEASQLRFFTDQRDSPTPTFYYILAPLVSGPIIKDRLWFMITDEYHFIQNGNAPDATGQLQAAPTYRKFIHKGTAKITWQINSRNKLSTVANVEAPIWEHNMVKSLGTEQEAEQDRAARRWLQGLIYESLLSDSVVFRSQGATMYIPQTWYPHTCTYDPNCDFEPGTLQNLPSKHQIGNNVIHERENYLSIQFANSIQWFAQSKSLGEHNLTLKDRFYTESYTHYYSVPGNAVYELNGPDKSALTTYYSNDPRYEDPRYGWFINQKSVTRHTTTLSDSWRPTRYLTVIPSVSHIWATGSNSRGDELVNNQVITPGVSTAWDATHDGRTVLRASYSQYVDVDLTPEAGHTAGSQAARRCQWNTDTQAYDKACAFSGGLTKNTFGSPCGPSGLNPDGTSCLEKLQIPRTFEYTAGAEREVVQGLALSLDFTHRDYTHQFEVNETNQIWQGDGTIAGYRNGRAESILDLSTPDSAKRQYTGVTFGVNKREGRLKAHLSYTWGKLTGNVFDNTNNPFGDIPARDPYLTGVYGADDHRHEVKASMQYQATTWLTLGARYDFFSGTPYNRLFFNPATNKFEDYRASAGFNAGTNINDPGDDRPLRLPDRQELNAQVRVNLLPLIGQKLDLYVDVLNVLAQRTVTSYGQNDGQNFGVETGWMDPFRVRLGLNYRY